MSTPCGNPPLSPRPASACAAASAGLRRYRPAPHGTREATAPAPRLPARTAAEVAAGATQRPQPRQQLRYLMHCADRLSPRAYAADGHVWIERPRVVEDLRALLAEINGVRRDSAGDDFPAASAPCVRDCNRPAPQGNRRGAKVRAPRLLELETTAVEAGEPLEEGILEAWPNSRTLWNISRSVGRLHGGAAGVSPRFFSR